MKKTNWTELFIFVVSAELVGALSALISGDFTEFYNEIIRPPFSPPSWIFPVVWAILYAVMGISAYKIYNSENLCSKFALKIYFVQLAVNFSWSIVFFRFRLLSVSAVIAVLLSMLVAAMTSCFFKISRSAGFLNIPYLFWSGFAAYLAIGTALLN